MALSFNQTFYNNMADSMTRTWNSWRMYIYPSSVPLPSLDVTGSTIPAGHLIMFDSLPMARSNNSVAITTAPIAATGVATGTAAWAAMFLPTVPSVSVLLTDSIASDDSLAIIKLSSMNIVSGQQCLLNGFSITWRI